MKKNLTIVLILAFLVFAEQKVVVIGGFEAKDSRDSLSNAFFRKYISENLSLQNMKIDQAKMVELNYLYGKNNNLFLAAREMLQVAAAEKGLKINEVLKSDLDVKKRLNLPDYLIYGQLKYYGKKVDLALEIYSSQKNTTVYKNVFDGRTNLPLDFYNKVTQTILVETGCMLKPVNIFGISDNSDFTDYLRYLNYQKNGQFEKIFDELEALPKLVKKYPEYTALLSEAQSKMDKAIPSVFGNIIEKKMSDSLSAENPTELLAKKIITEGYKLRHRTDIISEAKDTNNVNIMVYYDIQLKKVFLDLLNKEMKKRKADNNFANMGRYFFSADKNEGQIFKETLVDQKIVLRVFAEDSTELFQSEIAIAKMTFEGGGYRHSDNQPFPLMPLGPADNAFNIKKKTDGVFIFEDIPKLKFKKVKFASIEIAFD